MKKEREAGIEGSPPLTHTYTHTQTHRHNGNNRRSAAPLSHLHMFLKERVLFTP